MIFTTPENTVLRMRDSVVTNTGCRPMVYDTRWYKSKSDRGFTNQTFSKGYVNNVWDQSSSEYFFPSQLCDQITQSHHRDVPTHLSKGLDHRRHCDVCVKIYKPDSILEDLEQNQNSFDERHFNDLQSDGKGLLLRDSLGKHRNTTVPAWMNQRNQW